MAAKEEGGTPKLDLAARDLDEFQCWYSQLPQGSNTIRFFDRKNYYSVHGEHALLVARQLYKSTAQVTYAGGKPSGLPGVTISFNLFPGLLHELLIEQGEWHVELYEGSGSSWRCTKRASPGMWKAFENELSRAGELSEVPVVAAVAVAMVEGTRTVGLAYVNPALRVIGACEFADDEHFCALESALVQLGAREAALPKEGEGPNGQPADRQRLLDVLSRCGALPSERPRSAFSTRNLEQDLARLLRDGAVEQCRPILERQHAAAAIAGVLSFSELLSDPAGHGRHRLELLDTGRAMRLDSAAQRALNVFPSRADAANSFSLYGLLNRGRTAMGKRLLKVWLKQPLVDVSEISTRHDVVEALLEDTTLRCELQQTHLRGLPDIERLVRKLERQRGTLSDLCQLYRASFRLPQIADAVRRHEGPHAQLLATRYADPLSEAHDAEHLAKFEELLEAAVDLARIPDEYLIAASYDQGLQEVENEKEGAEAEIQRLAAEAARDLGLVLDKNLKLEWHKSSNQRLRCLRITAKDEKLVRKKLQSKYMELETRKDGVKFTNRALRNAAERLQQLSAEYDRRQQDLVSQVVSVAATFCEVWDAVCAVLAELDVLTAFAEAAATAPTPYTRPTMLPADGDELSLLGSRHPCVEAQDGISFISNDCIMRHGTSWFQIITGPNMGGKSTFIRQVGVIVLMAQVGCFVPCSHARISVRDAIFARVGAGDCQLRGVSTFMAEMLETAAIIKGASSRSLVIIDELGRGTSTWDGMGLAWSISEHLMDRIGCPTLFATHFHELTLLTGSTGVLNRHVRTAVDKQSGALTMLYQVDDGPCDQSFGIHVAEYAKFPAAVVELAKKKAQELEGSMPESTHLAAILPAAHKGTKRVHPDEGTALREALLDFAALQLDGLGDKEAREQVAVWAQKVEPLLADVPAAKRTAAV